MKATKHADGVELETSVCRWWCEGTGSVNGEPCRLCRGARGYHRYVTYAGGQRVSAEPWARGLGRPA